MGSDTNLSIISLMKSFKVFYLTLKNITVVFCCPNQDMKLKFKQEPLNIFLFARIALLHAIFNKHFFDYMVQCQRQQLFLSISYLSFLNMKKKHGKTFINSAFSS